MKSENSLARASILIIVVFAALILAFTVYGVVGSPQEAQVGTPRPYSAIPVHLAELILFGGLLAGASAILYGRKGLPLLFLTPSLVVLLDLDHLPAYIGLAQPIRPAHSFVFILTALVFTGIILRRIDLELVLASSFMGHLGVDTGLFPPLSPISFEYVQVDPYRVPLLVGSVTFALLAGFYRRKRTSGKVPQ